LWVWGDGEQRRSFNIRVGEADRAFYDVGQGGDSGVGVKDSIEWGALMLEKVEKHPKSDGLIKRVTKPWF
jgi:hypothetical protein